MSTMHRGIKLVFFTAVPLKKYTKSLKPSVLKQGPLNVVLCPPVGAYLTMKVFIVLLAVCVLVQAQKGKGKGKVIISFKNKI